MCITLILNMSFRNNDKKNIIDFRKSRETDMKERYNRYQSEKKIHDYYTARDYLRQNSGKELINKCDKLKSFINNDDLKAIESIITIIDLENVNVLHYFIDCNDNTALKNIKYLTLLNEKIFELLYNTETNMGISWMYKIQRCHT